MDIGIPREIKVAESRVALTPEDCKILIDDGNSVFLQSGAGLLAGFSNEEYQSFGVTLIPDAVELFERSKLIVKVKEPQPEEITRLQAHHILFCYLHLASDSKLVDSLQKIGLTAVAFETVKVEETTPLLAPMSAIAGRLSVQIGTRLLHVEYGGSGVLLGGINSKKEGNVTIIGAGIAGMNALALADGMGAHVHLVDIDGERLKHAQAEFPNISTRLSLLETFEELLPETDLLIGAVYVRGKKAPRVVTASQIQVMKKGSVVVDIAIDQGGCIETARPCTHREPAYILYDVIHSAINNLPAAVPRSASKSLSSAILPFVRQIASNIWTDSLQAGINIKNHKLLIDL